MWNNINIAIIIVEIVLLAMFFISLKSKNREKWAATFMASAFAINLVLYMMPGLHSGENFFVCAVESVARTIKDFVGEFYVEEVHGFSEIVPWYAVSFFAGAGLAVMATASTTVLIFDRKIRNRRNLSRMLKSDFCDIVVGKNDVALKYASSSKNAILLIDGGEGKETENSLMESGYTVLRHTFSEKFLSGKYFRKKTRYNIICCGDNETFLDYINVFVSYKNTAKDNGNIFLFLEVEETKAETVRQEIIEKIGYRDFITTFSRNELFARMFVEKHPITEYLPENFVEDDTSLAPDVKINVFMLGFGRLSREIYRQFAMNNQFVAFEDDRYCVKPVNYYIYDETTDPEEWNICGIEEELKKLEAQKEKYFSLPEMPYKSEYIQTSFSSRELQTEIFSKAKEDKTFNCIIIDTGDIYRNIEFSSRLKAVLEKNSNFHIFVRNEISAVESDVNVTYYGDFDAIFTHEVIVNESLSALAKKINEEYTRMYMPGDETDSVYNETIRAEAEKSWRESDYFTVYSNITLAVNLRLKLHLLGLDYVSDGKGENVHLIKEKYPHKGEKVSFDKYTEKNLRGALLAQEHARWNAYHLMSEWMPIEKEEVSVSEGKGKPRPINKNKTTKKHACITTFDGLTEVSQYIAQLASDFDKKTYTKEDYDYYINDEMLLVSAKHILPQVGYSITERN